MSVKRTNLYHSRHNDTDRQYECDRGITVCYTILQPGGDVDRTKSVLQRIAVSITYTHKKCFVTNLITPRALLSGAVLRGVRGGPRPPLKNVAFQCPPPHFGPVSIDFHLNRPVISLIQLHIVTPQLELWPPIGSHLASARTAPDYFCLSNAMYSIVQNISSL